MSDDVETTTETATVTTEQTKEQPSESKNEIPDWARQQISKANQEAANYRVQLREATEARQKLEEQVSSLSTVKSELESQYSSKSTDFDKLATAVQTLFPDKPEVFTFAKTLQGANEDELRTHATELRSMFGISSAPSPAVDRSQGIGGQPSQSDPASEFAKLLNSSITR